MWQQFESLPRLEITLNHCLCSVESLTLWRFSQKMEVLLENGGEPGHNIDHFWETKVNWKFRTITATTRAWGGKFALKLSEVETGNAGGASNRSPRRFLGQCCSLPAYHAVVQDGIRFYGIFLLSRWFPCASSFWRQRDVPRKHGRISCESSFRFTSF